MRTLSSRKYKHTMSAVLPLFNPCVDYRVRVRVIISLFSPKKTSFRERLEEETHCVVIKSIKQITRCRNRNAFLLFDLTDKKGGVYILIIDPLFPGLGGQGFTGVH